MKKLQGKPASKGIAVAHALKLETPNLKIEHKQITDVDHEIKLLVDAKNFVVNQIEKIVHNPNTKGHAKEIFAAHLELANDEAIVDEITNLIKDEKSNAAYAANKIYSNFINIFASSEDAYMRERASDIKDISTQIIAHLLKVNLPNLNSIQKPTILVCDELTPSQLSQIDLNVVKGYISQIGGETAHVVIMAKNIGLPAVIGLEHALKEIENDQQIVIDGNAGTVIVNPTEVALKEIQESIKKAEAKKEILKTYLNKPSTTKDGHKYILEGNIGTPEEATNVAKNGGEGIGLFRSEFLYMEAHNWPTEEEQFKAYKEAVESLKGQIVVIRTLDIGGDKKLNYYSFPHEENPFLGYRAIRLCLDQPEIFKTQIRALLRASVFGKLAIMLPMVATIEEIKQTKEIIKTCEQEVKNAGHKIGNYTIGIMIEIPAAAVLADQLIKHVDFFSIGTNDLIQYSIACDRQSDKVSYLYQPFHPAVLRLINMTIQAGKGKSDKWVGMCGSMAGDVKALPILVGLGLHSFSMPSSQILEHRYVLSQLNQKDCEELAHKSLNCESASEVKTLVKDFFLQHKIDV